MRSDTIKRHDQTHIQKLEIDEDRVDKINDFKIIDKTTIEDLREELLEDNNIYLNKIELGRKISLIIQEGVVQEESLIKERQDALALYRKRRPRFDISRILLRPWQEEALTIFEIPTDRSIIWICGQEGNEGKSWFQSYIEGRYGFNRVVRVDLRIKHANICNVLKKRTLSSVDIFIFNDTRSVSGEDHNLYRILEDIKDGQATASKYDNDNIYFKTPNIVVVFSNQYPDTKKLSYDRWIILKINDQKLENVTETMIKKGKRYSVNRQKSEECL